MMKNIYKLGLAAIFGGAVLAVGSLLPTQPIVVKPAEAAATVLCSPTTADSAQARSIGQSVGGGSQSAVPSGTLYTLNGQGCTVVKQQDVGYFLGLGFSPGPPYGANLLFTTGVATGTTSFQIGILPPSTYIQHVIVANATANAVTGNIAIGSTSGGTDVISGASAIVCGANCLAFAPDAQIAKRVFSLTAPQALFANAVTSWNNANVTITVVYGYF